MAVASFQKVELLEAAVDVRAARVVPAVVGVVFFGVGPGVGQVAGWG